MKILFWNVHRNVKINDLLVQLITDTDADIIGLSEYNVKLMDALLNNLNKQNATYYLFPIRGCPRIQIISKLNTRLTKRLFDCSYYTIRTFPYGANKKINITFVHFPICYIKECDKMDLAAELRESVEDCEIKSGCHNSIIVGDYNMNPFETQIYAGNGLNAIPISNIASKYSREVRKKERLYFYNPMWNMIGDFIEPAGSYYKYESSVQCLFWNLFDQVCIRPSLIDSFKQEQLKYITKISDTELLKNNIPNIEISDHLPLFFEL